MKETIDENVQENSTEEQVDSLNEAEILDENVQDENHSVETNKVADDPVKDHPTQQMSVEDLTKKIEQISAEKDALHDQMIRIQAEYENYKKRSLKERAEERKYKSLDLANELLPVLDNFERALQVEKTDSNKNLLEGVLMVYNQFKEALKSQGIEEISAEGEKFDPNLHHAVMQVENESSEPNTVVEELQKGYILNDRVIRATMVKVNK